MMAESRCCDGRKRERMNTDNLDRWIVCLDCGNRLEIDREQKFHERKMVTFFPFSSYIEKTPYFEYFLKAI
jgi:hypothetical protein